MKHRHLARTLLRTALLTALLGALAGCGARHMSGSEAARAQADLAERSLATLAHDAVSTDAATASTAIAALRAEGPRGHAALFAAHADAIRALAEVPPTRPDAASERLRHAIDVVSGQRDGHASGLYWHTDLEAAQREATTSGRPILSLRLLGRLDEEMSCANSRYFRLVLYSNRSLADHLRSHYVLHWSSERPVPRVRVDMGDGRVLERTLTGNSIHYVLDARGRVLDAMPGLSSPAQMLSFVARAESANGGDDDAARAYLEVQERASAEGVALAMRLHPEIAGAVGASTGGSRAPANAAPSALVAMPLTVSKLATEGALVDALRAPGVEGVARDAIAWFDVGRDGYGLTPEEVFDAQSLALLRLKTGEDDVSALAGALARSVVADTARNRVTFQPRVLGWLLEAHAQGEAPDLATFNERVYRELFLTPASDPWLGLTDPTVWDAIERLDGS